MSVLFAQGGGSVPVLAIPTVISVANYRSPGDVDYTNALRAAKISLGTAPGILAFGQGTFGISDPAAVFIQFSSPLQGIAGVGEGATVLVWDPAGQSGSTFVKYDQGNIVGGYLARNFLIGVTLTSSDTTRAKTLLDVVSTSGFICRDTTVGPGVTSTAKGAIGILIRGGESHTFDNVNSFADRPWLLGPNPYSSTNTLDHANFNNIYAIAATTQPVWERLTGGSLSNCSWTGRQAWVGGTDGFKSVDTTSTQQSFSNRWENVRKEQSTGANSQLFDLEDNAGMSDVQFINCKSDTVGKGWRLRKVSQVTAIAGGYVGATEGWNCDATCSAIQFVNHIITNGAAVTMTGLIQRFAVQQSATNGTLNTAFWDLPGGLPVAINLAGLAALTVDGTNNLTLGDPTTPAVKVPVVLSLGAAAASSPSTLQNGAANRLVFATRSADIYLGDVDNDYANLYIRTAGVNRAQVDVLGNLTLISKLYPMKDTGVSQAAAGFYAGAGAPINANGANGDFYFRSDGGALTTIYQRRAAAWVGIV